MVGDASGFAVLARHPGPTTNTGTRGGAPRFAFRSGEIMSDEDADALITGARAAGQILRWLPGFTKASKSGERHRFYSRARTWKQYGDMWNKAFVSGISGTTNPQAVSSELCHDVARGISPFANADTPVAAGILPDADDADL